MNLQWKCIDAHTLWNMTFADHLKNYEAEKMETQDETLTSKSKKCTTQVDIVSECVIK